MTEFHLAFQVLALFQFGFLIAAGMNVMVWGWMNKTMEYSDDMLWLLDEDKAVQPLAV